MQAGTRQTLRVSRGVYKSISDQKRSINYDAGTSDVEALLHENLIKSGGRSEERRPQQILTTQSDAIQLYRDIWRYSRLFVWRDENGRPWRDVIRESARREFEQARHETDHTVITRLLLVGRDAVMQAKDKFMQQREKIEQEDSHPSV